RRRRFTRAVLVRPKSLAVNVETCRTLGATVGSEGVPGTHVAAGRRQRYRGETYQHVAGRSAPAVGGTVRVRRDAGIDDVLVDRLAAANLIEGIDLAGRETVHQANLPPLRGQRRGRTR